tara:strand:- start:484 stop:840 length:357 start_codon:yes stop_codon:yes gene_type:complete
MSQVVDEYYEEARQKGEVANVNAMEEAASIEDIKLLRALYADAIALNAYYVFLESRLSTMPRLSFDAIRDALREIKAEELMYNANLAKESGFDLNTTVAVKTKPLLTLLSRCHSMVNP